MDRRDFLKTTSAAAALAATTAAAEAKNGAPEVTAPAIVTHPTREYRLGVRWADIVSGPADLAQRLAIRIREASNGRIRLILDHSNPNDAEFIHASEHERAALHPAFSYFASLPADAGLSGGDLIDWVSTGGGQDLWDELASDFGDKAILAGHLGPNPVLWSNRKIEAESGLRGLRLAVSGTTARLASALGATPVNIEPAQLAAALKSGTVDAAEHGATLNAMAIGLTAAARYAVAPSLTPEGTAIALRIRSDVWDQINQADRAIISTSAAETYRASLAEARLAEKLLLQTLQSRGELTTLDMPADVTSAFPHLSETIVAELSAHDMTSRKINASYMLFRRQIGHDQIPIA